jgi:hypothetical protein
LRLDDHRLLHGLGPPRGVDETHGLVGRERAGPNGVLNFRQHNARGDPHGVSEGLSAKHGRRGAGRTGHDCKQVAHPIEDHDRDTMPCAEAQRLDAHKSAPAGHDDGGRHPRARVVSQAALVVMDKERAALDGEAGVVGLRRDDARLDRKTRAPEGVGFSIRGGVDDARRPLRFWGPRGVLAKPPMLSQVSLKCRPCVWPGGRRSIVLVRPKRRRFAFADRRDDRRRVEWIASWTSHGSTPAVFCYFGVQIGSFARTPVFAIGFPLESSQSGLSPTGRRATSCKLTGSEIKSSQFA